LGIYGIGDEEILKDNSFGVVVKPCLSKYSLEKKRYNVIHSRALFETGFG